ncbi:DUF3800 domain-containing protein [Apilactobacillus sp. TMW 2.2459]|uniref:DUF3800 domain-containing protein n=1 Tax=Apilactobacillus xinyiensis TaxID=2841032 RepID=UPI00200EAEED|nr:DUF3800 domain-containing protein [Apilactobacillus xinyiensis]MCL0312311.1 DUF3800 domain-containing protein [Apilactobacillus xinyiensis]
MVVELYLDESKSCDYSHNRDLIYCVSGLIIKSNKIFSSVKKDVENLKKSIWSNSPINASNIILHEADMRDANRKNPRHKIKNNYEVFKSNSKLRKAIKGIGDIIERNGLDVIGVLENETSVMRRFHSSRNSKSAYRLAVYSIIEKFCFYLNENDETGTIIFESRRNNVNNNLDKMVKSFFFDVMSRGTDIYSREELQERILGIKFIEKSANNPALQVVDFVQMPIIINYMRVKQPNINIYRVIKEHKYKNRYKNRKIAHNGGLVSSNFGVEIFD